MVTKSIVCIVLLLSLGGIALTSQTSHAANFETANAWAQHPIGSKVYAEIINPPDAIYRQVIPDSPPSEWIRENNTKLFGEAINVSERHRFLDREYVLRVTIVDQEWGLIEPDGLHSPYIPEPTDYHPTYIHLSYLTPLTDDAFTPINVYPDTQPADKVIVVIADHRPRAVMYEGDQVVLHTPVVLGPTPYGDFRVYRTRATDDMPGIPAVPWSNYFSGGFSLHGAPWWNWKETVRGHYGSHGCVNLPDKEWYQIEVGDQQMPVAQWVYRWVSTNIDYDESDPEQQQARVGSEQRGWYEATESVRLVVVSDITQLDQHPLPGLLGDGARDSQITDWQPLIDNYLALNGDWYLPHQPDGETLDASQPTSEQSIAQLDGTTESDIWVLLPCDDTEMYDQVAYEGSSRTIGEVCYHLMVERQNSICTPERVDIEFFGERVLCSAPRFNGLYIHERGELIEHEKVHLTQFSGYFKDLFLQGVASDDPTPFAVDYQQLSVIGITELLAQTQNISSRYAEDYVFALARPDENGNIIGVRRNASTGEAWAHVMRECGDPTGEDAALRELIERALWGEADAYQQLDQICSLPLHRLVPDRWREA